jgi:hypothetical protein
LKGPYFFLTAAVFGLDAGFFFAAGADTPKTDSFNALAGVKRNRVRAGILMDSPVAGLRPMRAFSLRLRKIPKLAERIDPSFLSSRTMSALSSSSVSFASFLLIPNLLDQMAHHLRLRHPSPPLDYRTSN